MIETKEFEWIPFKELNSGDRLVIKKESKYTQIINDIELGKKDIYVTFIGFKDIYYNNFAFPNKILEFSYPKEIGLNDNIGNTTPNCCIKIDPKGYEKYDKILKDEIETAEKKNANLLTLINTTPKKTYKTRDFNYNLKDRLNSNLNYCLLGNIDEKTKDFKCLNLIYKYQEIACCAFSKCLNDIEVNIPKCWLNYYEYTTYDLIEWLKFLKKCDFGFDYEYKGEVSLIAPFNFPKHDNNYNIKPNFFCYTSMVKPRVPNEFIQILLIGEKDNNKFIESERNKHKMLTYMRFICLRYIYNHYYWNIPGVAMQLKKVLGTRVTHMEALLMAHLSRPYLGYYCLVNNENYCKNNNRGDRRANPFQDMSEVVQKTSNLNMNNAFEYKEGDYAEKFKELFEAKDYEGVYNYSKEIFK